MDLKPELQTLTTRNRIKNQKNKVANVNLTSFDPDFILFVGEPTTGENSVKADSQPTHLNSREGEEWELIG